MSLDHYYSVAVIVEGTIETEEDIDPESLNEFVGEQIGLAAADGLPTEIWVLHHLHRRPEEGEDDDCSCDQYVTRHAPYLTMNMHEEVPENDTL